MYTLIQRRYNVEAHADMNTLSPLRICYYMTTPYKRVVMSHTNKRDVIRHIPRTSTVAMFVTTHESCEVSERQEQSVE